MVVVADIEVEVVVVVVGGGGGGGGGVFLAMRFNTYFIIHIIPNTRR